MKKRITFAILAVALLFASTAGFSFFHAQTDTPPAEYTIRPNGTLGTNVGFTGIWKDIVDRKYAYVDESSSIFGDYCFSLKEYFYDSDIGMMVYKIQVTQSDLSDLTEEQFDALQKEFDKDHISITAGRSCSSCISTLKREENDVYIYGNDLISALYYKANIQDTQKNILPTELEIFWGTPIYLPLPEYAQQEKKLIFDTSSLDNIYSCQLGEYGLDIVWDLESVINQFNKEMAANKKKPEMLHSRESYGDESYGYLLYETIELQYKDGSKKTIVGNGKNSIKVYEIEDDEREEAGVASTRIAFDEKINLSQVEHIIIDGVKMKN